MSPEETAKAFWRTRLAYPEYGTIKVRRRQELATLLPMIDRARARSVLDIGCGDGSTMACIRALTDVEKVTGCDISANLAGAHPGGGEFFIYDATAGGYLPHAEFAICAGVLPFIFEDSQVDRLLSKIQSPTIYVRAPCSIGGDDIHVNGYSEKLGAEYSSVYRTRDHVSSLLDGRFETIQHGRSYTDDIESEFGTKQFYWLCER